MRLAFAYFIFALLALPALQAQAAKGDFLKAVQYSDYRKANKLRSLLHAFVQEMGNDLGKATTEELRYATDIASCLWNVTPDETEQEQIAALGYKLAEALYKRNPEIADGEYLMAVNLMLHAQSKGVLSTLFSLGKVKKFAEKAYATDPDYFYSSPRVLLGALYLFAPGFPVAFGNMEEAERYLIEAIEAAPKQTTPLVLLGALYAKKGDKKASLAAFRKVRSIPPWTNPQGMYDKDMDFWWHVDQIRAIRALRELNASEDPREVYYLVEKTMSDIDGTDLTLSLKRELAK